jgi:hypothetical protein
MGAYIAPQSISQYCHQLQRYNVEFTWAQVPWNLIEPKKGQFVWTSLDQAVQAAHDCGLEMGFKVHSRSKWGTLPITTDPDEWITPPSTHPKDLNDYYKFIYTLANRYKDKVNRYSIEEEAHAQGVYYEGTPEQYMEMLKTAHRAIHDANPKATVQDSGISNIAIAFLYAKSKIDSGNTSGASQFLNNWFANYAKVRVNRRMGKIVDFNNPADLDLIYAHPQIQRLFKWTKLLWSEYADSYDIQQIHYCGPWQYMPEVIKWYHDQMARLGKDKPVEFWTMSYGWNDINTYDPQTHAIAEAKYHLLAVGEGALRTISWQFTDYAESLGHHGLVTDQGPRPAAQTFAITAEKINGVTSSQRLNLGQDIWAYRFEKPDGVVYAVWAEKETRINLPINAAEVKVTDLWGNATRDSPSKLLITSSPLFVEKI